jgi:hypothetical protein
LKRFGLAQGAPQDVARVPGERLALRCVDVADQLGGGVRPALPGDDGKGGQVRIEVHVALGDAGEALDRTAVEPFAVVDAVLQLVHGDGDALDQPDHVRKLEADEADALLLGPRQHVSLHGGSVGALRDAHTRLMVASVEQSARF